MKKILIALLLALPLSALAGTPVYAVTAAPSGACNASSEGQRVQVVGSTGAQWCCVSGTWNACAGASVPDATATTTGGIRLTGDLTGTALEPLVMDNSHNHSDATMFDINASTISTGTVAVARLPLASETAAGIVQLSGDLNGTSALPNVVDDSHGHTGTTVSSLSGADITTGTVAVARLPPATTTALGVVQLAGDMTGTAALPTVVDDSHAHTGTTISALDGADITSGVVPTIHLPQASTAALGVVQLAGDLSGISSGPQVNNDSHTHNGTTVAALDGADITTGTVAVARLGSGTPSTATYLRGDGSWSLLAGGGDADTLDGIDSSRIVYGANSTKTQPTTTMNSLTLPSGFYELDGAAYPNVGAPVSGTWVHLIHNQHTSQNYGFDLAHPFFDDDLYVRRLDGGTFYGWYKLARSVSTTTNRCTGSTIRNGTEDIITTGIVPAYRQVEFRVIAATDATGTGHRYMFESAPAGSTCSFEVFSSTTAKVFAVGAPSTGITPASSPGLTEAIDIIRCTTTGTSGTFQLEQLTEVAGSNVCARAGTTYTIY